MLYTAWRYGGEDPYRLYHGGDPPHPTHPDPWRYRCLMYAFGSFADDRELQIHGVHPSQNGDAPPQEGTEMRMPGGQRGYKK